MTFYLIPFSNINVEQLYKIYKLRCEVFIVEQLCAYQDVDDLDVLAHHILLMNDNELIAYARIIPPFGNSLQPNIGRVVVQKNYRKKNYGKKLIIYAIQQTQLLFPKQQIVISAQSYLIKFYTELGFAASCEGYLEDNIPHVKMYL